MNVTFKDGKRLAELSKAEHGHIKNAAGIVAELPRLLKSTHPLFDDAAPAARLLEKLAANGQEIDLNG